MQKSMIIASASASVLLLGLASTASATAVFSVTASSTLEFEFPSPDEIAFDHNGVVIGNNFNSGGSGTTFSVALSPDGVLPVTTSGTGTGSASPFLTVQTAIGFQFTSHVVSMGLLINTMLVPFTFTYSWDVDVAVDDPAERAVAGALFSIKRGLAGVPGSVPQQCLVGGTLTDCNFDHIADTDLGQSGTSGSATVTGNFVVPQGFIREFTVFTEFGGAAFSSAQVSPVPEPATFALLGAALLGLVLRRQVPMDSLSVKNSFAST